MPIPVITAAQMRVWEQVSWAAGKIDTTVIARVGELLAERARALTRADDIVLILAGKGHNGDDARQMIPHLANRRVELVNVEQLQKCFAEISAALARRPALVVDGLFGLGLNRPLDLSWQKLFAQINAANLRVLAVDLPSGLHADTGEAQGAAIRAELTITVGAPKCGLLMSSAGSYVGRLEVATDIGLVPCPLRGELLWTLPEDFADFPPRRPAVSHKGTFGHLAILAGSLGYHGAAVLAARGAQRAIPGLITVWTAEECYVPVASQLQAVMVRPWGNLEELSAKTSAVLLGPGLAAKNLSSSWKATCVQLWRESPLPVVADASALAWLPMGENTPADALRIITPHPGEAARMLGVPVAGGLANRTTTVRELSRHFGHCWVVYKGHQTLVGRSDGEIFINSSGNPGLAQGGSGDLLAGFLAGALAQPTLQANPLRTLRHAVWEHGAAADRLTARQVNWTVEELATELGHARTDAHL